MTYAYDQPLQIPVSDLYDTNIMAMAIKTAKDMYEKGQEELKDFYTTYGDFTTPLLRDLDWYNQNVTGKVRNLIDWAYSEGIDLARSKEGRMLMSRIINDIDVGTVAKLKSSAEVAKEFIKSRKELERLGLYNEDLAKYDAPDMSTYSTLESGIWSKGSPTPYQNVATFGNPYFEGMKPNIRRESKNGIEYSVESITMDDLRNIADAHFNELISTPQGRLMYQKYLDMSNNDHAAAREMFNSVIADGQRRRIYTQSDYDDQYYKRKQLELAQANLALDAQKLDWQKFTDQVQLGLINLPGQPGGGQPLSYTTQMETNSISQYNKKAGIDSPGDYAKTTYDISEYWRQKAESETDASKKAYATKMQNFWLRMNKEGYEKAEANGVFVKDKNTGELVPSPIYAKEIGLAYGAHATGRTSTEKARTQADVYYNRYLVGNTGITYNKTSADALAGGAGEQKSFPGGAATNKYRTVQLDDMGIYYTPIRRLQVAGYSVTRKDAPLLTAFNDWLHSSPRLGYMVNAGTTTASLPTVNGGRTREISGYARIKLDDLIDGFIDPYIADHKDDPRFKTKDTGRSNILKELGLPTFTMDGRQPGGNKYLWKNMAVVEIPITRVNINNSSTVDASWNLDYDINAGGKAAADKKVTSRQIEALSKK